MEDLLVFVKVVAPYVFSGEVSNICFLAPIVSSADCKMHHQQTMLTIAIKPGRAMNTAVVTTSPDTCHPARATSRGC